LRQLTSTLCDLLLALQWPQLHGFLQQLALQALPVLLLGGPLVLLLQLSSLLLHL
jgi:hypothetical protein